MAPPEVVSMTPCPLVAAFVERPILFSAPMVRALLDGSKTQTRRALRKQPPAATLSFCTYHHPDPRPHHWAMDGGSLLDFAVSCPYGATGERLWVRETFDPIYPQDPHYNGGRPIEHDYRATYTHGDRLGDLVGVKKKWTPAIHMPRAASRIDLEITGVRVERLQDISDADLAAEGIQELIAAGVDHDGTARDTYRVLWEALNGAGSWAANPWVWCVEFRRIRPC